MRQGSGRTVSLTGSALSVSGLRAAKADEVSVESGALAGGEELADTADCVGCGNGDTGRLETATTECGAVFIFLGREDVVPDSELTESVPLAKYNAATAETNEPATKPEITVRRYDRFCS